MIQNTRFALLSSLLAVAACAGCISGPPDADEAAVSAVSSIAIDMTTLTAAPPASLPSDRVTRAAFGDAVVTVQTGHSGYTADREPG